MNHSGPDFNRQSTLWNFEHVFGWVTSSAGCDGGVGGRKRQSSSLSGIAGKALELGINDRKPRTIGLFLFYSGNRVNPTWKPDNEIDVSNGFPIFVLQSRKVHVVAEDYSSNDPGATLPIPAK